MQPPFAPQCLEWLVSVLHNLADEFYELATRVGENFASGFGGSVILAMLSVYNRGTAFEVAEFFKPMKGGIKRPLAEPVAVADQLLGDLRAVNRLFCSVVENM